MKDKIIGQSQLGLFKYSLDPDDPDEPLVEANYYIAHKSVLVLCDGSMVNLAQDPLKKDPEKSFKAAFPKLAGDDPHDLQKWYSELVDVAVSHHVYIHPYYLFHKNCGSNKGFTVGDSENDDLPKRFQDAITEWGLGSYAAGRPVHDLLGSLLTYLGVPSDRLADLDPAG